MKISASVYSNKNKNLTQLVLELDQFNIDYIHIDCNDDICVFDDIKTIKAISKTPIDLHIISDEPEKYFNLIIEHKIELVTFQFENLKSELIIPSNFSSKIGIALMTNTNIDIFNKFQDIATFVLFMTTTPGMSGGLFDEENFEKIRKFRELYPNKRIHVDGGVNEDVSFILRNLGVYCAVSGSYLVKSADMGESLIKLKTDIRSMQYYIHDFMMKRNELPIVSINDLSFKNILYSISRYKLGFCLIEDENRRLYGVTTDGDIRRAILNNLNNLNNLLVELPINKHPMVVTSKMTVSNLLNILKESNISLTFLPVVDDNGGELIGAVSFQNFLKGEL